MRTSILHNSESCKPVSNYSIVISNLFYCSETWPVTTTLNWTVSTPDAC